MTIPGLSVYATLAVIAADLWLLLRYGGWAGLAAPFRFRGLIDGLAWAALALCLLGWLLIPVYPLRYRLTLAVEADGVVHSASSVIEASFRPNRIDVLSQMPSFSWWQGTAPIIDLGSKGWVAASLEYQYDKRDPETKNDAAALPLAAYSIQ
jgi:hypothetical protein